MEKQKLRSEIEDKYKWELESIYKNEEEFNNDKEKVLKLIDKISTYKGKITNTSENLLNYLKIDEEIMIILTNLYIYSSCKYHEDVSNSQNFKRYNEISNIDAIYSNKTSFAMPELLKTDYNIIKEYIKENSDLKEYEYDLKEIYKFQKYVLSEKEEKLLSNINELSNKYENNFEVLLNSILDFGTIKDENGNEVELTIGNYSKYIQSKDRRVRKEAYENKGKALKKYISLFSIDFEGNLKSDSIVSKTRGYNSTLEMFLYPDDITEEIYNNLLKVADKKINILYKYYNLIKNITKIDNLKAYDLTAPLTENSNKKYTPEDAKKMIIDALQILGEDYIKVLTSAFDDRWIDFYSNKGKRNGYYETSSFKSHPLVLGNYNDDLNSVSAICHELGHAMHSYYSNKNNKEHNSQYTILVAEVASLTNEMLLSNYIVNNSSDKNEKLSAIENILSVFESNFFGTLSEGSIFEKIVHEKVDNNEVLSEEDFNNIYEEISNKYYGDMVEKDEYIKYNWARVPHFYSSFYYYKYSIGVSCACYVANKILNNDEEFKQKYLKFLTLGSSMSPVEELKTLGIDLSKEDVFIDAINYFDSLIDKFTQIYNS